MKPKKGELMKEKNKEIKKLSEFVNLAWEVYSSLKNDNEKYFLKAIERADKLFDLKISRHYDRNFILKQEYLFIKFSYDIHCCFFTFPITALIWNSVYFGQGLFGSLLKSYPIKP